MIFGSTLLEVAIGVVFVYLLVSLLCSALNELIEAWLKYRARYLEQGIRRLLNDPGLAEEFFRHPLVRPLGERPSYIPARTFSLALWNIATTAAAKGEGVSQDLGRIRGFIQNLPDDYKNIRTTLLTLIDEAGNDLNKARANVEAWYDDAMDRVSGWYKRRTHVILIVIGLIASFALNIDTIQITRALLYNDTLRKSVADAAETYVRENPAPTTPAGTQTTGTQAAGSQATGSQTPAPTPTPDPVRQAAAAQKRVDLVRTQLNQLGLPIGWPVAPDRSDPKYSGAGAAQYDVDLAAYNTDPRWPNPRAGLTSWALLYGLFLKLLGLILTGLAVSQGAPFWFDLLNKFMVIRSTVKPREKSRPEGTKDKRDKEGVDEGEGGDDHDG